MELVRVDVFDFRSIKELQLEFNHGCQILVGINESGKSNILKALQLLDPATQVGPADLRLERRHEDIVEEGKVRFVFRLDDEELDEIYSGLADKFEPESLAQSLFVHPKRLTLKEWCEDRREGLYNIVIPSGKRFATTWAVPSKSQFAHGWYRSSSDSPVVVTGAPFDSSRTVPARGYVYVEKGESSAPIKEASVDDLSKAFGVAVEKVVSAKLPKCIFWKYADQYLLPSTVDTSTFCASPDSCVPLKSMFELAGYDTRNLTELISKAQQQGQYRYSQILERVSEKATEHIRRVWKDHSSISIRLEANGPTLSPVVRDEQVPLDMVNRSDGFKRFVGFLLNISAKVHTEELTGALILVDEPEIGLHPTGAKNLLHELIEIGKSNKVVFSTHSIFMIDRDEIGRHLIVEKKNEVTVTKRAEKSTIQDEEVLYGAMGYSIFETVKAQNVIFEGWKDKELFKVLAASMSKGNRSLKDRLAKIGMTFAEGVKDVRHVARFLELAARPCLVVSDADNAALQRRREYLKPGAWGVWKTLAEIVPGANLSTAEDLLVREAVVRRANKFRSQVEGLDALSVDFFHAGENTLSGLARWIKTAGVADPENVLDSLKVSLFENLKRDEISDHGEHLVTYVAEYPF